MMNRSKFAMPLFASFLSAASAAFAVADHSLTEFPRLAGEKDDAPRFQRAVDACRGGGLLAVPGGNYTLSHTVFVTNLCSIEMSPGARIKAIAEMDWMFKINQRWQYYPKTAPKDVQAEIYNLAFRGGTLDADGKASCLAVDNYRHFTLENATFLNGKRYGVAIETEGVGYEMVARNLYFKTLIRGLAGNTAVFTCGGDSQYTDIIIVDYTVGFHVFSGGANRLTRVHVWGGPVGHPAKPGEVPDMLKDSVCFRIAGGNTILRDCYADTGAIGFWNTGNRTQMFGCLYFNNVGFGLRDVTVIRHDGGALWCEGGNFQCNTSDTRLYVASPGSRLWWGENNICPGFKCPPVRNVSPVSLQEPLISIDGNRQLMLDNELAATNTMKRIWHRPASVSRPVAGVSLEGGVWYDGKAGCYKGWSGNGGVCMTSKDGDGWTPSAAWPPEPFGGADRVRVTMDCDALDGKPFKAYAYWKDGRGCVSASADGSEWCAPIRTAAAGDLGTVFYNPFTRLWGFSFRDSRANGGDAMLDYHEADSFFGGAKVRFPFKGGRFKPAPTPWVRGDRPLRGKTVRDLRNFGCVAYEGVMIGLAEIAEDGKQQDSGSDLWFAFTRNRWHWTFPKPSSGSSFISRTGRNGDWNGRRLVPNPGVCTVVGDELRFYHSGYSGIRDKTCATGYATLRRDGFCSVQDGELLTRQLVFTRGDRLWVNADVRHGELRVRVEGHDGKNFRERRISGVDSARFEVGAIAPNRPFALRFVSTGGAKLYSFWVGGADGRSGGHMAGGSPDCASMRDCLKPPVQSKR